jgi:hypothetical protein
VEKMNKTEIEANFYNDVIKKNIVKDLKIRLNEYQLCKHSNCTENVRQDKIRNIKSQLWEWAVSKKDLEKI